MMAQTEERKRLVMKHPNYPRGKIAGYEWVTNVTNIPSDKMDDDLLNRLKYAPSGVNDILLHFWTTEKMLKYSMVDEPLHDSYEPGIKVEDEWWFEGDIFEVVFATFAIKYSCGEKFTGELKYLGVLGWIISDSDYKYEISLDKMSTGEFNLKRISNIHEEATNGKD